MNKALTHDFVLNSRPDNDMGTLLDKIGYDVINVLQCIVMKSLNTTPCLTLNARSWWICGAPGTAALSVS